MSDVTDPTVYPEKAALQLVFELIRAEKIVVHHDQATGLLKIYDQAVAHFKSAGRDSGQEDF